MMVFKCHECNKDIHAQQLVGTVPPQVHLNTFCSEECLNKTVEKNKQPPSTDVTTC